MVLLTKCAVKCSRSARTNAIFIHRIHYIVFNTLIADKIKIVVGGKIYTRPAINCDIMFSLITTIENKQKQILDNIIHTCIIHIRIHTSIIVIFIILGNTLAYVISVLQTYNTENVILQTY